MISSFIEDNSIHSVNVTGDEPAALPIFFQRPFRVFFFFQAEDGIRDLIVTGVQTCALPISLATSASCTVSVNVQGTTAGVKNNSVQVTSTEGGTGNTSNASITVVAPPIIIKAFGAGSIPLNGATSLTFTLQNNNSTTTLTGIGFSDTLPAGLVIATPNGLTTGCQTVAGSVSTAGTVTATQGTNVISLSGLGLNASGSCTFSVNVKGTSGGVENNTTGNVTAANRGGRGGGGGGARGG